MTKKVPLIFHNLRGHDSHLIMQEIGKSDAKVNDVKVNVIPNGLAKCMAFIIDKGLVFIGGMQFMNSSLDAFVKTLSDNDFKYLSKEFTGDLLELVKQKRVYPYEYIDSFEKFYEDKLLDRCELFRSLKDWCISEKDESISEKKCANQ